MDSIELVARTIRGTNDTGITPVYGWIRENLKQPLIDAFGSVENFEDQFHFDMAHIFGGPFPIDRPRLKAIQENGTEITPDVALTVPLLDVDDSSLYRDVVKALEFYRKERRRFCCVQCYGAFEPASVYFGIENELMNLLLYPDEMKELFLRQAEWNVRFVNNMMDLGVDMIHISDDWGSQESLMFSPAVWREMIFPAHKIVADAVKKRGKFLSLHSDGCIRSVLDGVAELGYDVLHPWQEDAGMDYALYKERYREKFALLGGVCVQSTLGFGNYERLEREIRRVFATLEGERWICCTTHFVQEHCSMEELQFAYELIDRLAGKK